MTSLLLQFPQSSLQSSQHLFSRCFLASGLADLANILPNITQPLRLKGDNVDTRSEKTTYGFFNLEKGHGAHLALILRYDQVRLESLQHGSVDAVHAQPFLHDLAYAGINRGARTVWIQLRLG